MAVTSSALLTLRMFDWVVVRTWCHLLRRYGCAIRFRSGEANFAVLHQIKHIATRARRYFPC